MKDSQVSLGSASLWYVILFPFSAVTLLVERQEVHSACKKLGVGLLVLTICLVLQLQLSPPPPSSLNGDVLPSAYLVVLENGD